MRLFLVFALCVALGLGLGLWVAWEVWPLGTYSDHPSGLRSEYKEEYVLMIAEEYLRYGDLDRVEEQSALLALVDPLQAVIDLLEAKGESAPSLAHLAYALGGRDSALMAYLPTPSPTLSRESELSFHLLENVNLGCGEFPESRIMVYVQDGEGSGIPNVELKVSGPQGDDLLYTGLKPGVDLGLC